MCSSSGSPEEVEVSPLEVLIVKSKGEDRAEIVIRLTQYIHTSKKLKQQDTMRG